jgi:hypothetical protein
MSIWGQLVWGDFLKSLLLDFSFSYSEHVLFSQNL